MPKIYLHLVRHAQGFHNLNVENHSIPDPLLTPLGEQQCAQLSKDYPTPTKTTHLIASPLRRTLYTALLSFPSLLPSSTNKGLPILAMPEVQETSSLPCDTGSSLSVLEKEFSSKYPEVVDFSRVTSDWNSKAGFYSSDAAAISNRALTARKLLLDMAKTYLKEGKGEEVHMIVVTHGGMLHYFTEDFEGAINDGTVGTGWHNTEFRTYNYDEELESLKLTEEEKERAPITETKESRKRRSNNKTPLTREEQVHLKATVELQWANDGFQNTGGWKKEEDGEKKEGEIVAVEV